MICFIQMSFPPFHIFCFRLCSYALFAAPGIFLPPLGFHKTHNNFELVPGSSISYHLILERKRETRMDNRKTPIINLAQLATIQEVEKEWKEIIVSVCLASYTGKER